MYAARLEILRQMMRDIHNPADSIVTTVALKVNRKRIGNDGILSGIARRMPFSPLPESKIQAKLGKIFLRT